MRKYIAVLLCIMTVLALTGCGRKVDAQASNENELGVTASTKNVSKTGLTLVISQSGGNPTGEIETGSEYALEEGTVGAWVPVNYLVDPNEVAWTAMGYIIEKGGHMEMDIDWSEIYGELSPGHYRVRKNVQDYRSPGDFDTIMVFAEFDVE